MKAMSMRAERGMRESEVPDMLAPTVLPRDLRYDLAGVLDRKLIRPPEQYRIPIIQFDRERMTHIEAARHLGWP